MKEGIRVIAFQTKLQIGGGGKENSLGGNNYRNFIFLKVIFL
jgi:hypothetical protein